MIPKSCMRSGCIRAPKSGQGMGARVPVCWSLSTISYVLAGWTRKPRCHCTHATGACHISAGCFAVQQHRQQPQPAAASRSSTVSLHSKHSHEQEQTSNTVFSRVSTWHTLSDFKEERKESGGSHFYHPTTMFQPWMKIPLSQLFFLFSGLLEHCNELVIICFHSRKSAKL